MATYDISKITLPNKDVCDFFGGNRTIPGNLVVNGTLTIGNTSESSTMVQLKNSNGATYLHRSGANGGVYDEGLQGWVIMTDGSQVSTGSKLNVKSNDTWPEVNFWANGDVRRGGSVTCGVDTNANNVYFNVFHRSSGVNSDTYRDTFWLPKSGTDNAIHNYNILTTKDYVRDTSSMTGIHLQKCNNVVQISCRGCSVNSSGSFGTLPTGFRPVGYMYETGFITYQGGDKPCNIVIEADGTTKVYYFNGTSTTVATGGTLYANIVFLSW